MNGVQPFLYIDVNENQENDLDNNNDPADDPLALTEDDLNDFEENGLLIKNCNGAFNLQHAYDDNSTGSGSQNKKRPEAYIEITDGEDEEPDHINNENVIENGREEDAILHSTTEEGNSSSTETMSSEEEINEPEEKPTSWFRKENDSYLCNSCEFVTKSYETVFQHFKICHIPILRMVNEKNFQQKILNPPSYEPPSPWNESTDQIQIGNRCYNSIEAVNTDYLFELSQQLAKQCFSCPFCSFSCSHKEKMAQHIGNEHAMEIISQQYNSIMSMENFESEQSKQTDENDLNQDYNPESTTSPDSSQRRTRAIQFDTIAKEHSILARILEERHQENKNRFSCGLCSFKTGLRYSIISHFESQHGAKRVFSCDSCDYITHSEYFLKRHTNSKHTEKKIYRCKSCEYSSYRRYTMRAHIDSVHKKIKPYPCNQCKYSAARKDALKTHIAAVHEGKRPFSCNECTFSSSRKYLLKNHVKSFHGPDSNEALENIFTCGVCGLVAKTSIGLKEHLSEAHGGSTKSSEIQSQDSKALYACDLCNFKCRRRTNLYSHRKAMHAGPESSRRHPCPFCFYFAYKLTGLKGHITKCHKDCSYSDIDRIINAR